MYSNNQKPTDWQQKLHEQSIAFINFVNEPVRERKVSGIREFLKKYPPDILFSQNYIRETFHTAVWQGDVELAKLFLEAAASVKEKDGDAFVNWGYGSGLSPLHKAARNGKVEMIKQLLEYKADIERRAENGNTPLLDALSVNKSATAKILIDSGANIHTQNNFGETALNMAVRHEDTATIAALIAKGANPDVAYNNGQTPRQLAEELKTKHPEVLDALLGKEPSLQESDYYCSSSSTYFPF